MVRGIEVNPETGEKTCSHCGYEFSSFEDAMHHFENFCDPMDNEIKPFTYEVTIKVTSPANNKDKAKQNVMNWLGETQNSIGGLSAHVENFKHPDQLTNNDQNNE